LIIVEAVLMGVFAIFFMDLMAGVLVKRNIIYPFLSPEAVGRWFLYIGDIFSWFKWPKRRDFPWPFLSYHNYLPVLTAPVDICTGSVSS